MKKALIILLVLVLLGGIAFGLYYFFWTPENFATLGQRAMEKGHYDKAVTYYENAVELDPTSETYVISLANACVANGSYTQAERALVTALRTIPSTNLYCKLSGIYVAQDKLLDAQLMLDSINDASLRATLEDMRPAAPTPSHESGEYDYRVDLSFSANGGSVYLSTDDAYPTIASGAITSALSLPSGVTNIQAIVVGDNGLVSPVFTGQYLIVGLVEDLTFASEEMAAFLREMLYIPRTESITTEDLWGITELVVPSTISDLSDLAYFTDLTTLTIQDSHAEDYSFLAALPTITSLDLSGSLISAQTLTYIGLLPNLEILRMNECGLTNAAPIMSATTLKTLELSGNSITDLTGIENLQSLEHLDLSSNSLDRVNALSDNDALISVDLSDNKLVYISALTDCENLTTLNIENNVVRYISPLASTPNLTTLKASNNNLYDVSDLAACRKLTHVELAHNHLTDFDAMLMLDSLTYLDISYNEITALPAVLPNHQLKQFYGQYNQLKDISMLAGLAELNYVNVDYNKEITDIECLIACPLLVQVDAFGCNVYTADKLLYNEDHSSTGIIVNFNPVPMPDVTLPETSEDNTEEPTEPEPEE